MVATYNGKVIATPDAQGGTPWIVIRSQSAVDSLIAADVRWAAIYSETTGGPPVSNLLYDNGTPVTDWVLYSNVPADAESSIVLEPAFYFRQNG